MKKSKDWLVLTSISVVILLIDLFFEVFNDSIVIAFGLLFFISFGFYRIEREIEKLKEIKK